MDNLINILKNKTKTKQNRLLFDWQILSLEIVNGLKDGDIKRGSIFSVCRTDKHNAKIAWLDCKELGKLKYRYFFKVYGILKRREL
jgi:hypothetical protein